MILMLPSVLHVNFISVACQLHNICIDDFGFHWVEPVGSGYIPYFECEKDQQNGDTLPGVIAWADGTPIHSRY